jgi:hypothetical protein
VIIQIRDRPGFSLFLDRLSSLGLRSEVLDLSDEVIDVARRIQYSLVISPKNDEIAKEFKFGVELLGKWLETFGYDANSYVDMKEPDIKNNGRFVDDILKTNASAFCILRVSKVVSK